MVHDILFATFTPINSYLQTTCPLVAANRMTEPKGIYAITDSSFASFNLLNLRELKELSLLSSLGVRRQYVEHFRVDGNVFKFQLA